MRRTACLALLLLVTGCAAAPPAPPPAPAPAGWQETPAPDGVWRPHLLARCRGRQEPPSPADAAALVEAWNRFAAGEGDDAIAALEAHLRGREPDGMVLLALGQLYLLAAQGTPGPAPPPGSAAGDGSRDQRRLLERAAGLLQEATLLRPDDGAVEYLLADVTRAAGDLGAAARSERAGHAKCSLPESMELLRAYQGLTLHAARLESDVVPRYPEAAARKGTGGEVVSDLLISPAGEVAQLVVVASVDPDLDRAAGEALRAATYRAARVGKYPVWSWLRIPVRFTLTTRGSQTGS